jgi:DNA-binding SARP family transcriptional activator
VDFRILGPLEVLEGSRRLALGGPQQRAVLAILLLHAGEVVSAGRLIDELWGDDPPETGAKVLQGYVSQLRKALEPTARSAAESRIIVTRSPGYVVEVAPDELDLARFERLLAKGRDTLAAGDPSRAAELLTDALSLWRGPPLGDFADAQFAQPEIGRLEELRLVALEQRIEADLALGRHADAVGELERLVAEHPLRERLRGLLMLALYRSGRQAEALEAYREARSVLVDELGIDPGPELQRLEQAVLRQDPALEPVASPSSDGAAEPSRAGFVGREAELDRLLAGLDDALRGRGGLYLLAGEPGIGKSRLAEELAARARARGARVLVGRCWEAGGAPAYWPWVQSLRGLVRDRDPERLRVELGPGASEVAQLVPELREILPDLPEPRWLESEGARIRLFDAVSAFLLAASRAQPLVLVLDDLHAADEPSLLLLQFVARELADSRLLVLGAFRDVDPTIVGQLAATLAELAREPTVHRLTVNGLDEASVGRYIEVTAGDAPDSELVDAIYAETDGNPLFVGELVRLLSTDGRLEADALRELRLPEGIRAVIGRRLDRLSSGCRGAITLASVLGREFDLRALERVSGETGDAVLEALDEALSARVIGELPGAAGRLRFGHALIRDAVYEELTSVRRARLHGQVGAALEQLYAGDIEPHLTELAHHFHSAASAGEASKAVEFGRRAGDRAAALLAFEEAVRLYGLALELIVDTRARCDVLLSLGDAQARAGDTPSSKQTFLAAAELAAELGAAEHQARAALGYGGRMVWDVSRDDPGLIPLLESALTALDDGNPALRIRLLARLAGGPLRDASFPFERRAALSEEALAEARRMNDPATLAYALAGYIAANHGPTFTRQQVVSAGELIEIALAAGERERAIEGYDHRAAALLELGEQEAAEADLVAMGALGDEVRQPSQSWLVMYNRARFALQEGAFAEAEELISAALALGERAQAWNAAVTYRLQLYVLRWEQGRLSEIRDLVERSVDEYPTYPVWRCVWAHASAELGLSDDARRALDDLARDDFRGLPFNEDWLASMAFLADATHSIGEPGPAATLYEHLVPYADRVAVTYAELSIGAVARPLGILAALLGRWDEAEAHFEAAIALNAKIRARPWIARTQAGYAEMLRARAAPGDAERAALLLAEAAETRRALGVPPL